MTSPFLPDGQPSAATCDAQAEYRMICDVIDRVYAMVLDCADTDFGGDEDRAWDAMPETYRSAYAAIDQIRKSARAQVARAQRADWLAWSERQHAAFREADPRPQEPICGDASVGPTPSADPAPEAISRDPVDRDSESSMYWKCQECHLFVDNNPDHETDPSVAAYLHLHRGTPDDEALDETHEPWPGGEPHTLWWWRENGPYAMRARFILAERAD